LASLYYPSSLFTPQGSDRFLTKKFVQDNSLSFDIVNVVSEIVCDVKEKSAYVVLHLEAELQKAATTTDCNISSPLPNGDEIVTGNERFH
jgi:hypothetical protein